MLRPATPLTVLLFVAFVLLLISVISTPVVKNIPLASFHGIDFGVFGYCGKTCSGIKVGYSTSNINDVAGTGSSNGQDFSLPSNARSSLSSILIVHPIAALLTLICLILAASAHLHAPSHSPRYLLALLILLLPTLLITLLAFLVDILLFVPHLAWGGWIVLGSTILITASGVVTCAMRRTLVSRKARKKRIAENAEMNGENYYNRHNATRAESPPPLDSQPTVPMANGGPGPDQLPAFATYDSKVMRVTDEERMPLNTRTPSNRTLPSNGRTNEASEDGDRYAGQGRGGPGGMRGGHAGPFNGPRDEFGNPLPSSNAFGPVPPGAVRQDSSDTRIGHQYSNETMNSQSSRGRGRGGYPPRGYGRGGPHGSGRGPGMNGNGRGIPMGPMAAGAGAGMMAAERGRYRQEGPPPGYAPGYGPGPGNGLPQGRGMPSQYNREMSSGPGGAAMYGRDPSASGYGRRPSPGPPSAPGYGRQPSPGPPSAPGYGRQPSPGPPSAPGYGRQPSPGPPSAPGYGRQPSPGSISAPNQVIQSSGPPSAPGYGRQPSPGPPSAPGHGRQPSPGPPSAPGYGRQSPGSPSAPGAYGYGREPSPGPPGVSQYRADSPPPPMPEIQHNEGQIIGQAVEMDAYTGSPSHTPVSNRVMHLRDGDQDVHIIGQQQQQQQQRRESPMSATSVYSGQEPYVPPRAAWVGGGSRSGTPLQSPTHPLSPIQASPVELPAQSPPHSPEPQPPAPSHIRFNSTDNYYEDVDPRFTEPQPPQSLPPQPLPNSLMPGGNQPNGIAQPTITRNGSPFHLEPSTSYESIPEGARSHASDASNYTSISQRGINPNWRPPSGQLGVGMGSAADRRPVQRDVLQANPDFELPASVRGGRMLGPRGGRGGRAPGMIPGMGQGGGGRYPEGEV
ncbi:regulator of ime2 [Lobaria immixta]|nr:regulator of ime2 [Lobaria immixta]